MKTRINLAVVLVVAIAAVIWGFHSRSTSTETIKIGFVGPLTVKLASIGESSLAGAELAVTELNESGGLLGKKVELIAEDDQCSATGVEAFTKLIYVDKVVAISGPDCSSSGSAALPLAEKEKVPTVVRWASAPPLAKIGDYIFRIYPSDTFQGKFIADYIHSTLKKKRVAVLYVKNDWGQGITDVFTQTFRDLGGSIVAEQGILEDARDLRSEIQAVKFTNPDIIFAPLHEATGMIGLKQIQEAGITVPVIGGDVFDSQAVFESPGASGVMYSAALVANPEDFQRRIKTATGKDGSKITASLGYDSIMVIAKAIQKAGSTEKEAVRKALAETSVEGVSVPKIEFDADGDLIGGRYEIKTIP